METKAEKSNNPLLTLSLLFGTTFLNPNQLETFQYDSIFTVIRTAGWEL